MQLLEAEWALAAVLVASELHWQECKAGTAGRTRRPQRRDMPGHHTFERRRDLVLAIPWCPWWASRRTRLRRDAGTKIRSPRKTIPSLVVNSKRWA